MQRYIRGIVFNALGSLLLLVGCSTESQSPADSRSNEPTVHRNGDVVPGQYIVVFKADILGSKGEDLQSLTHDVRKERVHSTAEQALSRINAPLTAIGATFGTVLYGVVAKLSDDQVKQLRSDRSVAYVEPDRYVSLPPISVQKVDEMDLDLQAGKKGGGSGGSGTGDQSTPWGITMVGGSETPSGSITAWIVDTGIDLDHPDLNVNVSRCKNYVTTGTNTTTAEDGHGHGTHCGGIVGAKNNTYGVVGVAPGINLVAMRVLDNTGAGQWSWSISAFDYIAANGAAGDVVNYSVGPGSRYSNSSLDNAVINLASKGIRVCIAAGNQTDDCAYYSPAKVNATNVFTIASMGSTKSYNGFSNYGTPVDWIEPGNGIVSTYKNGAYASMSGTSMASPHAAGILAVGGIRSGGTVANVPANTVNQYGMRD